MPGRSRMRQGGNGIGLRGLLLGIAGANADNISLDPDYVNAKDVASKMQADGVQGPEAPATSKPFKADSIFAKGSANEANRRYLENIVNGDLDTNQKLAAETKLTPILLQRKVAEGKISNDQAVELLRQQHQLELDQMMAKQPIEAANDERKYQIERRGGNDRVLNSKGILARDDNEQVYQSNIVPKMFEGIKASSRRQISDDNLQAGENELSQRVFNSAEPALRQIKLNDITARQLQSGANVDNFDREQEAKKVMEQLKINDLKARINDANIRPVTNNGALVDVSTGKTVAEGSMSQMLRAKMGGTQPQVAQTKGQTAEDGEVTEFGGKKGVWLQGKFYPISGN